MTLGEFRKATEGMDDSIRLVRSASDGEGGYDDVDDVETMTLYGERSLRGFIHNSLGEWDTDDREPVSCLFVY